MRDEDIEPLGAEPGDIVGVGDLVVPPIDAGRAVAPVDGERPAEEAERAPAEVEARPLREVGDILMTWHSPCLKGREPPSKPGGFIPERAGSAAAKQVVRP